MPLASFRKHIKEQSDFAKETLVGSEMGVWTLRHQGSSSSAQRHLSPGAKVSIVIHHTLYD